MKKYSITIAIGVLLFLFTFSLNKPNVDLEISDFFSQSINQSRTIASYNQNQRYYLEKNLITDKKENKNKTIEDNQSSQIIYNSNTDRQINAMFYDRKNIYLDNDDSFYNNMTQDNFVYLNNIKYSSSEFNPWEKTDDDFPKIYDYFTQLKAFENIYSSMDINNLNNLKMLKISFNANENTDVLKLLDYFGLKDKINESNIFPEDYDKANWEEKTITLRLIYNINDMYLVNTYCDFYIKNPEESYKAYSSTDYSRINVTRTFKLPKKVPNLSSLEG